MAAAGDGGILIADETDNMPQKVPTNRAVTKKEANRITAAKG